VLRQRPRLIILIDAWRGLLHRPFGGEGYGVTLAPPGAARALPGSGSNPPIKDATIRGAVRNFLDTPVAGGGSERLVVIDHTLAVARAARWCVNSAVRARMGRSNSVLQSR